MGMPVPVPTIDPGPQWASDLNSCLGIIDSHTHIAGSGVPITPNAINMTGDLPFNQQNATLLRSVRLYQNISLIAASTPDLGCLYSAGTDLYFNDGAGNQVRITQSGTVSGATGTITGLPTGTASALFSTPSFIFQSATLVAANVDMRNAILRNSGVSSYGLTLSPPTLGSNITQVLPAIPGSTSFMTMDNSGNMLATTPIASGITTGMIASGAITASLLGTGSVTSTKLAAGAVTTAAIAAGAVVTASIGVAAITSTLMFPGAITSVALADAAVVTAKIAPSQITTALIASGAVVAASLASGAAAANLLAGGDVILPALLTVTGFSTLSNTGIGVAPLSFTGLRVGKTLTGNSSQYNIIANGGSFDSTATVAGYVLYTAPNTASGATTIPVIINMYLGDAIVTSGNTPALQVGILAPNTFATAANTAVLADNVAMTGHWFINQTGTTASTLGGALGVTGLITAVGGVNITGAVGVVGDITKTGAGTNAGVFNIKNTASSVSIAGTGGGTTGGGVGSFIVGTNSDGLAIIYNTSTGNIALVLITGGVGAVTIVSDPASKFSVTGGTASKDNITVATSNTIRIEHNSSTSTAQSFRIFYLGVN